MERWLFAGLGLTIVAMAAITFFPAIATIDPMDLMVTGEPSSRGGLPTTLSALNRKTLATNAAQTAPEVIFEETSPAIWIVRAGESEKAINAGTYRQGSAVAITTDQLLTNCHVLEQADAILVSRGEYSVAARRLKSDEDNDKCVLVVEEDSGKILPVKNLRSTASLKVGERVFTVGAPRGLELTMGEGIVAGIRHYNDTYYIQTTAPISPGSSGGGLFDTEGNLVGITTLFLKESQGINFAIAAEEFWDQAGK